MALSIFEDKSAEPADADVARVLGKRISHWDAIKAYVLKKYPGAIEQWNYAGKNYGWSFRLKDRKRAIVHMIPGDGSFLAALVFGDKAVAAVEASSVPESIKQELAAAKKYAEGRGIRVPVKTRADVGHVKKLIDIKLAH